MRNGCASDTTAKGTAALVDGRVSIITPCYNGELFIAETILSVMIQTYAHWEMFVVDDGSTDRTAEIAEFYAAKDDRIHVLHQKNAGTASARNRGLREATGRFIALLDADDVWDVEFLDRQLSFMAEKKAEVVCCSYRHIDERSNEIQHPTRAMARITPADMRVMNRIGCLTGLYDASRHGIVYLHEELKSIRDDYAYWYEIVCKAGVAYGNPDVLASYRVQTGSTTGNKLALVAKQYHFYRQFLHLGLPTAVVNTLRWGISGLGKFS